MSERMRLLTAQPRRWLLARSWPPLPSPGRGRPRPARLPAAPQAPLLHRWSPPPAGCPGRRGRAGREPAAPRATTRHLHAAPYLLLLRALQAQTASLQSLPKAAALWAATPHTAGCGRQQSAGSTAGRPAAQDAGSAQCCTRSIDAHLIMCTHQTWMSSSFWRLASTAAPFCLEAACTYFSPASPTCIIRVLHMYHSRAYAMYAVHPCDFLPTPTLCFCPAAAISVGCHTW